jgi:Uri superfamily endonuclease
MPRSYQLHIVVRGEPTIRIGKLGVYTFPGGRYLYTGSARRNLAARIARHLTRGKKAHWHIDYLLGAPGVGVETVTRSTQPECVLNGLTPGEVLIARFGATDCRAGCGSHLKFLGPIGAPEPSAAKMNTALDREPA